jgi:hypothetical protein
MAKENQPQAVWRAIFSSPQPFPSIAKSRSQRVEPKFRSGTSSQGEERGLQAASTNVVQRPVHLGIAYQLEAA